MDKNEFIIDNNVYIIGKDHQNKSVTNKEVHDVIFQIFIEIDRICRKNNIPYALSFGSALGLYNYGGFIPWDDDGDIAIDYFDYHRLVEALKNDLDERFVLDCYETNTKFNALIPPIKVRFKNSYIKERNHILLPNRGKLSDGVFVDICTFMGVPENVKEHKKIIWKNKWRILPYIFLDAILHITPKSIQKKIKKLEEETAKKYIDSAYVSQTVRIPFQEYPKKMVKHLSFPREVIYPFREYKFNGARLFSFNNVEEFCRLRYGEESLKQKVNGEYISKYQRNPNQKSEHIIKVDIY